MDFTLIIIISIIVLVVIFLLLREINCWYWKINERIELAKRQNLLLEKILQYHIGEIPDNNTDSPDATFIEKDIITSSFSNQEKTIYESLSYQEKMEADKFIRYGLSKGDKLVINKISRKIDRFDEKEWAEILKKSEQTEWIIISEK